MQFYLDTSFCLTTCCSPEIILSVLLMRFRFSSTDDHIVWNLSQIISPSVRTMSDSDGGPLAVEKKGLPLIVQMLEDAA